MAPHKQKPVKLLEDYINSSYGEVKGGPELRDMVYAVLFSIKDNIAKKNYLNLDLSYLEYNRKDFCL